MKQPYALIEILLNNKCRFDERDDAAMDLSEYDEIEAEEALISIAKNKEEPSLLVASAGESLAEIWLRNRKIKIQLIKSLREEASKEIISFLETKAPELLSS